MTTPPPTPPTPPPAAGGDDEPTQPPPSVAPRRGPGGWSSQPHAFGERDSTDGNDLETGSRSQPGGFPRVVVESGAFPDRSDEGASSLTDPADLPLFANLAPGTPTAPTTIDREASAGDARPGRVRSDFALRPQPGLSKTPRGHQADNQADNQNGHPNGHASTGSAARVTHGGSRAAIRVDWDQVTQLRAQASDQLTAALEAADGRLDEEARRQLGRSIIHELLTEEVAEQVQRGRSGWSVTEQNELAKVVFDALFGLGRLQPLVDDERVENIVIAGCENVWLELDDGTLVRGPAVAESDEQLIGDLVFLAERSRACYNYDDVVTYDKKGDNAAPDQISPGIATYEVYNYDYPSPDGWHIAVENIPGKGCK